MKAPSDDLLRFLKPFPDHVKNMCLHSRDLLWQRFPESNELIYDNYNALVMGWSHSEKIADLFISVTVYSNHISLGFHRGSELEDPENLLEGTGKLYRHYRIPEENFPNKSVLELIDQAHIHALYRMHSPPQIMGRIITKSVSPSKRRPK